MRQLRGDVNAALAEGRDGPLPVQRLRPLLQDERPEPAADQTQTATRKSNFTQLLFNYLLLLFFFFGGGELFFYYFFFFTHGFCGGV